MNDASAPAPVDGHLSVSALAARDGVTKQAVSKRLRALGDRIATVRRGRERLVHLSTWDALKAEIDPAQALRNSAPADKPPGEAGDYQDSRARLAVAQARKAEMDLAREAGELVPAAEIAAAAAKVGERIAAVVGSMKARTSDLFAAAQAGGEDGFHAKLSEIVDAQLTSLSDALRDLAHGAG